MKRLALLASTLASTLAVAGGLALTQPPSTPDYTTIPPRSSRPSRPPSSR
jgi:hypothetical protein